MSRTSHSKTRGRFGLMSIAGLVTIAVVAFAVALGLSGAGTASAASSHTVKATADSIEVQPPTNPATVEGCGPNATWNLPADADTDEFDYHTNIDGTDLMVTDQNGNTFPAGPNTSTTPAGSTYDYGLASDSAPACPDTSVTPTSPTVTKHPSCSNTYMTVAPSNDEGVIWSPSGQVTLKVGESVTFTASADEGFVIQEGAQTSFPFKNTFDTSHCVVIIVDPGPVPHHTSHHQHHTSSTPGGLPNTGK